MKLSLIGLLILGFVSPKEKSAIDVSKYPEEIIGHWASIGEVKQGVFERTFQFKSDHTWVEKSFFHPEGKEKIFVMVTGTWEIDKSTLLITALKATHEAFIDRHTSEILSMTQNSVTFKYEGGKEESFDRIDWIVERTKRKRRTRR